MAACAFVLAAAVGMTSAEDFKYTLHGKTWVEGGRIMEATDSLINGNGPNNVLNLKGNVLQSLGAQFTVQTDIGDHLEAGFGFGVHKVNHASGKGTNSFFAISLFHNFITQSRLTWFTGEKESPDFSATVGSFPFIYNPDVKNLGAYLFRGSVYPGILMGGFQDFGVDSTKSSILGLNLHHKMGNFSHNLILNSERDIPPTLDWSLGYVAKFQAGPLQLGAGANFYRLIAYKKELETPGKYFTDAELGFRLHQYIDTTPGSKDTTFYTHQGTKLMGMASLDLQKVFGMELANPDDMRLYTELAVIGVKDYGPAYDDITKRIPVVVGFNIPTGGFLNHLSLEVEYYGAQYRSDLVRVGNNNVVADWTLQDHPIPSAKPADYSDYGIDSNGVWNSADPLKSVNVKGTALDKRNVTKDDIKWSLFFDKVISNHVHLMGQVANDHFRSRPVATGLITSAGGTQEAFASPKDWYFMVRMGYFF